MSRTKLASLMIAVLIISLSIPVYGEEKNRDLMLETSDQKNEFKYKTVQVSRGDLVTKETLVGAVDYPNSVKIYYDVKQGKGIFQEFLVEKGEHVEAGTPIISVKSTITTAQIEEMKLKLFRVQEDYYEYYEKYDEFLDEEAYRAKVSPGYKTEHLAVLKSKKKDAEFIYRLSVLQKEIDRAQRELKEYEEAYLTTQVVAPKAGIVGKLSDFKTGKEMESGCYLTEISQTDKLCLSVRDDNGIMCYGMEAMVKFENDDNLYSGRVISPQNSTLTGAMQTNKSYIELDEVIELPEKTPKASVFVNSMNVEDVLLVEVNAISEDRKGYFVNKLIDDRLEKAYIMIGQANAKNAYVMRGLNEGDIVVTE